MSETPQAAVPEWDADILPAIRAASDAIRQIHRKGIWDETPVARAALEAAAPLIAAAQREADAQLAEAEARRLHERGLDEVSNAGEVMSAALEDFADLLRNPPEGDSDGT